LRSQFETGRVLVVVTVPVAIAAPTTNRWAKRDGGIGVNSDRTEQGEGKSEQQECFFHAHQSARKENQRNRQVVLVPVSENKGSQSSALGPKENRI
jgi:hypothetical protein